jgi:hypothetical protein
MSITLSVLLVGGTLLLEPEAILNMDTKSYNRIEVSSRFLLSGKWGDKTPGNLIDYKLGGFIGNSDVEVGYEKRITPGIELKNNSFDGVWSLAAKLEE